MTKERNQLVDILKGIGCIMVILLHAAFSDREMKIMLFPFWCSFAVPVFMFLSGYVNAMSLSGSKSITSYYKVRNLLSKLVRFIVPFIVAYAIECIYYVLFHQQEILGGIKGCLLIFLQGGIGPGSYYIPIMVQFIVLYPIIFLLLDKYDFIGLLVCAGFNLLFEVIQALTSMNPDVYRLLLLRYTLIIALGSYSFMHKKAYKNWCMILSFAAGFIYVLAVGYLEYQPVIFKLWSQTSMLACLYIGMLLLVLFAGIKKAHCKPLELIGKASYNVFLTQMIWYAVGFWFVQSRISNKPVQVLISLAACLLGGFLFYTVDNKVTPKLLSLIRGK